MRYRMWPALFSALMLGLATAAPSGANIPDENVWPFFQSRTSPIDAAKEWETGGPLIYSRELEPRQEWGFRPLFSVQSDKEKDETGVDVLYPIFTFRRRGEDKRYQFFELFSVRGETSSEGVRREDLTLFPFIFHKRSTETEEGYFGVVPFYGNLKNRFGRDEINFRALPAYLRTRKGEVETRSYMWPFISITSGGGVSGFNIWPFYGKTAKPGSYSKRFIMWPFFMEQETDLDKEVPKRFVALLPFYASLHSEKREFVSYLWPFFSRVVERDHGYVEWNLPFPFIMTASGEGRRAFRVWPLYGQDERKGSHSFFVLWPLYRFQEREAKGVAVTRRQVLLILYTDFLEERREEAASRGRRSLWPIFTYRWDDEGNASFQILSILEPLMPENRAIERNYSPLWGLYRYARNARGDSLHSLLWNLFRREAGEGHRRLELLGPLILAERNAERGRFSILRGLIGFGRDGEERYFKLLYIKLIRSREGD